MLEQGFPAAWGAQGPGRDLWTCGDSSPRWGRVLGRILWGTQAGAVPEGLSPWKGRSGAATATEGLSWSSLQSEQGKDSAGAVCILSPFHTEQGKDSSPWE